ncbi:hypothetical protein H0A64_09955 [Alcaligenaceae bacterium]|nr:hypothetical protein [Alcaligenaceae bacterium]
MSGATTAAIVSTGAQVASTAISASGSYHSASVQKTSLDTQARMADINARIAEMGAQSAMQQGKQQVAALTHQTGQLKGRQRATLAANGVDLGVGNAAEIQASTDIMKNIDAGNLKMNALRTAFGYRTQGMNATNEASMARANAQGISPGGAAASTLLGGATQVASNWYSMSQTGMFDKPQYASIDALAADKGWW